MKNFLTKITRKNKKGQSLAEYGLILALIAIVCIAALTAMGNEINNLMTTVSNTLSTAINTAVTRGTPAP